MLFDYADGAAGDGHAELRNRNTLQDIMLQPRILKKVESLELGQEFFGKRMNMPFGIAPMGMCNLSWPGADLMLARLAARHNIPVGVSTAASTDLETMFEHSRGNAWFQLYVSGKKSVAEGLCKRAANTGYDVLVLTVDVPQVARRPRELRHGFKMPFKMGPSQFMDFALHPNWSLRSLMHGAPGLANFEGKNSSGAFNREQSRGGLDWDFLKSLRDQWKSKLVIKGVLSVEDALMLKQYGVDAIQVSSHGGRQLNSAPSPITKLAEIREAVGKDFPLIYDSGIRTGDDIIKAYAMGADFVMLGRVCLYALGGDGERGLNSLSDIFATEMRITLAQLGLDNINLVDASVIAKP